jgi:hypothetical protein
MWLQEQRISGAAVSSLTFGHQLRHDPAPKLLDMKLLDE